MNSIKVIAQVSVPYNSTLCDVTKLVHFLIASSVTFYIMLFALPAPVMASWHRIAYRITDSLWEESTDHRWIPSKRARNAELYAIMVDSTSV